MSTAEAEARTIRSLIPARLDRLSRSPFHTRMVTKPLTSVADKAAPAASAEPAAA
jgi:hypothetical protein